MGMEFIFNEQTKGYEIKEFNKAFEDCKEFIENNGLLNVVIQNDDDKKAVKNARTTIRKKKDELASLRKQLNEIVMGKFNSQVKEVESLLDTADKQLKAKLDDYEQSLGKPKKLSIIVSSYDEKVLEKVRAYALELKCEVK